MNFSEVDSLLERQATARLNEHAANEPDVVFVLFLEPRNGPDPAASLGERLVTAAVEMFQPSPVLAHCELVVPPAPGVKTHTNFATYLGQDAAWQADKRNSLNFYLIDNAARWRAVPVFATSAAARVREECTKQAGTPYSVLRYLSSTLPLRAFANLLSDERLAPAHCATLTTRVLKKSLERNDAPTHASAYYGPSTLYMEMCARAAWTGKALGATESAQMDDATAVSVEMLLRAPMTPQTVAEIGDEGAMRAVRALSFKACNALIGGDDASQVLSQRQLATALLRWIVLRDIQIDPDPPAASLSGDAQESAAAEPVMANRAGSPPPPPHVEGC